MKRVNLEAYGSGDVWIGVRVQRFGVANPVGLDSRLKRIEVHKESMFQFSAVKDLKDDQ